jgi:hypothetical protein
LVRNWLEEDKSGSKGPLADANEPGDTVASEIAKFGMRWRYGSGDSGGDNPTEIHLCQHNNILQSQFDVVLPIPMAHGWLTG